jgi:hypothetical protein
MCTGVLTHELLKEYFQKLVVGKKRMSIDTEEYGVVALSMMVRFVATQDPRQDSFCLRHQ